MPRPGPEWKIRSAWVLLITSTLGWPLSMFTVAKDEPPFILSLSWLAIIIECLAVLWTAEVHKKVEE